jgi:hypothetical protein
VDPDRGGRLVNVPIGVLAVALTAWRVEESCSPHPTPPDWAGFALLTTGLVRRRDGQPAAGLDRHRRGPAAPGRHGLRGQLDVLLVTAVLATGGALCALLLIRSRALSPNQQSVQAGRTGPVGASPVTGESVADGSSPARSA